MTKKQKIKEVTAMVTETFIESGVDLLTPKLAKDVSNAVVSEVAGQLIEELITFIIPFAGSLVNSYKMKRMENNINESLRMLAERDDEIQEELSKLKVENNEYIHKLCEGYLDNIIDEIQKEKVVLNTNGFINIIKSGSTNLDTSLMFFRTLAQLSNLDIRILKIYVYMYNSNGETVIDICNDLNIDFEEVTFVKEKLERFGLLKSTNDENIETNTKLICEYFEKVSRENRKRNPKVIDVPKLKKIKRSDTYKITKMGIDFLKIIEEYPM